MALLHEDIQDPRFHYCLPFFQMVLKFLNCLYVMEITECKQKITTALFIYLYFAQIWFWRHPYCFLGKQYGSTEHWETLPLITVYPLVVNLLVSGKCLKFGTALLPHSSPSKIKKVLNKREKIKRARDIENFYADLKL